MKKPMPAAPPVRKVIALPPALWQRVSDWRFAAKIPTEAEALRRLVELGLGRAQEAQR